MTRMNPNVSQTAGLPMYDPPELHPIVDAWWSGIARALRAEGIPDVPDRLDRCLALDALWGAPDLLLTQTCGFPLFGSHANRLQYVATPRYAAPGCAGADYCSWIVVGASSPVAMPRGSARHALLDQRAHLAFGLQRAARPDRAVGDGRPLLRFGQRERRARGKPRADRARRSRRGGDRLRDVRVARPLPAARHRGDEDHRPHRVRAGPALCDPHRCR